MFLRLTLSHREFNWLDFKLNFARYDFLLLQEGPLADKVAANLKRRGVMEEDYFRNYIQCETGWLPPETSKPFVTLVMKHTEKDDPFRRVPRIKLIDVLPPADLATIRTDKMRRTIYYYQNTAPDTRQTSSRLDAMAIDAAQSLLLYREAWKRNRRDISELSKAAYTEIVKCHYGIADQMKSFAQVLDWRDPLPWNGMDPLLETNPH